MSYIFWLRAYDFPCGQLANIITAAVVGFQGKRTMHAVTTSSDQQSRTHTHSFKCHMSMFCKAKPHYYFVVLTCRSTRKVNTIVSFIKVTGEKKNSGSYGCLPLVLYIICSTPKFLLWMHEQYNYGLCAFTVYLGLLPFS